MPQGIEKIGLVNPKDENIIFGKKSKYPNVIIIKGDAKIDFKAEYYKNALESSIGNAKWLVKPIAKYPFTKNDKQVHTGDEMGVSIPKKLCGPQGYIVEAFRYSPTSQYPTMIIVIGQTPYRIVRTSWSKSKGGANIKNGKPIKYGDDVWLNVQTEGLNNAIVNVSVYNKEWGSDKIIYTYTGIKCCNGEINLNIKNTFLWRSKIPWVKRGNIEEYYIKIRLKGTKKTILDYNKDDKHAVCLKVKDEVSNRTIEQSTSDLPLKAGKLELDIERYEPCSFDEIIISEPKKDPITIFKKGKNLTGRSTTIEVVKRSVYFKYDKSTLTPDAKGKLNNIIDFLSNNKIAFIQLNGWASIEGKESYNLVLSQKRADAVKDYFIKGGLLGSQIHSEGKGELKPKGANDDEEKKEDRDEKKYSEARKVEILFTFKSQNANALVYNTVAGSKKHATELGVEIENMLVKHCYKDSDKHEKKVIITSPDSKKDNKDASGKFTYPVFSNLPEQSDFLRADYYAPLNYIWPSSCESNNFYFHINSCRYFSDKKKASLIVKVFPDIKWTLAFELEINISNKKYANMPVGNLWKKHWKDAQPAGVNRSLIDRRNKDGELTPKAGVPFKWGFGLEAEWNKGNSKSKASITIEDKIKKFTRTIQKVANVLDKASGWSIALAKKSGAPVTFDIIYPKIIFGVSWYAEGGQKKGKLATVGEIGLAADPLIGAVGTIDLIALTVIGLGSPAAGKLYKKFSGTLEEFGVSFYFNLIFKGTLFITFPKVKIHSINGVSFDGGFVLGGKFTMRIEVGATNDAVGTVNAKKYKPAFKWKIHGAVEIGVRGELKLGSDEIGVYVEPSVEFSGAKIVVDIHGEFGFWSFLGFDYTLEETVIDSKRVTLNKSYITGN